MPIIKFLALVAAVFVVWLGIVWVMHNYGVMYGVASFVVAVFVGRVLSKKTIANIKAKREQHR